MRIATLTLNVYDNYGNMLQKYALYRTLEKFADFVEVLWHPCTKTFNPYELEVDRFKVGNLRDAAFKSVKEHNLKLFHDANMRTRFDVPYLDDLADEYDFFVVGSDQVWNPDFDFDGRFLEFAPREKRIAYAASIAVPDLQPAVKAYYREKISEMPHVSLRESEGVDLVEKLTGKRPLQVLDPVFLLTADEWRSLAKPPAWLDNKRYKRGYLLTYFFSGDPPEQVKTLAAELNLPLINLLDKKNFEHYITGVEEFLYLVDHATLLCTKSFHGTAFATIFKRPFVVYRLQSANAIRRFSRIESLIRLFGLSERATEFDLRLKVDDPLKIDFTCRDEVLPLERAKAFNFLSEALGVKPHEKFQR